MWLNRYWNNTRSPLYSFLFTVPLFIIYEIGVLLTSSTDMISMRNGADALMRQILSTFGMNGFYWMGGVFFIGFMIVYLFQKQYWYDIEIIGEHLLLMMLESFMWSMALYFFMSNVYVLLMSPNGSMMIQQVTLAVGAGIYEEFLFRVVLITGISGILAFIFQWNIKLRNWIAMILAAGIFSAFHFIGEFGDYFSFNIFMIRFFAGIILGVLYFLRGFGITAWAHSIYDLIVLTKITTQS